MIFLDTETALIEQDLLAPPLTCIQFAEDSGGVGIAVVGVDPVESLCDEILRQEIVGHYVAFDLLVIITEYPSLAPLVFRAYDEGRINDTITREKLRRIAAGTLKQASFRLSDLAARYGAQKDSDDPWRLRYAELRDVPFCEWPRAAQAYAIRDVETTRHVYYSQGDVIADEYRQAKYSFVLHCIGAAGVHTDPVAVWNFERQITDQYEEDQSHLQEAGLVRLDCTKDTKRAMARMVAVLGSSIIKTKKGRVSLSEEACQLSGDFTLRAYQRYGSHKNLLSRIQDLKKGYNKPLNARFDSLVETGRTSCSKGQHGYQLQNMRREAGERECFIPRDGNVFLACDYDVFELRTLAQVCLWVVGWSRLADALNSGLDPHLQMAAQGMGMSYEEAKNILDTPTHPRRAEVKLARQGAKIADFGYPGGMGSQSFQRYASGYGMKIDLDQAEELKQNWYQSWPEMNLYFQWISSGHQWYEILRGSETWSYTTVKQFRSDRVRGKVSYTTACNSYFQGLAADAAKSAGFELLRECELGRLQGWKIWNFVHDEYLLEGPEEDGHRAAQIVQEVMVSAAQEWVPDVEITASPHLMRRWSKKAEATYIDGVLVPWEDRV